MHFFNEGGCIKVIKMNLKNIVLLSVFIVCLVLIVVLLLSNSGLFNKISEEDAGDGAKTSDYYNARKDVMIDGEKYRPKKGVTTYLLIGEDKEGEIVKNYSYRNDSQADFLAYLIVDDNTKSYSVIHINRDTWADVDVLGIGGGKIETIQAQIALSHTYGDGIDISCKNTARSVSSLFFGLPVDHYVSLRLNAISIINDYVGGVTLTIPEDLTAIDPDFVEGATVHLTGDKAVKFIRARQNAGDQTNVSRMERQKLYIDAFMSKLSSYESSDEALTETFERISPYMVSKFSVSDVSLLFDKIQSYSYSGIMKIDGTLDNDDRGYSKFNADPASLKKIAFELLCDKVS